MLNSKFFGSGLNLENTTHLVLFHEMNMDTTIQAIGRAQRFGRTTSKNIGKRIAIILDEEAISAPVIRDSITGGNGTISGNFTFQGATDLALLLRSGALPTPLTVVEERTVGPDLGKDSIEAGVVSLIVGFLLVIVFIFAMAVLVVAVDACFRFFRLFLLFFRFATFF